MNTYLAGMVSGFVATVPMTVAMEMMHRRLPRRERYPLPPRQITMNLARKARMQKHLHEEERLIATLAAHFGYGAAVGALYAPLAQKVRWHPVLKGVLFGLTVWTVSYLGILPVIRVLPPATQQPQRRNELMIASHIIWGVVLALLTERLSSSQSEGDSPNESNAE
ncbi:MAG TPA: DUF1440 domain-containing protein [Abditibacteriaceae bacterium]|jgi:putative membrane protein